MSLKSDQCPLSDIYEHTLRPIDAPRPVLLPSADHLKVFSAGPGTRGHQCTVGNIGGYLKKAILSSHESFLLV